MPENWKTYRLKEIADVQTGPFGSQLHKKDYVDVGTPIITVEHLGQNRITYQNLPKVSETDKKRLSKYLIREGDVVFSRVGSVDRRALVTKKENNWLFSGRCLRVRPDEKIANGAFLSYFFGKESFKEHIRSIAVGATMPSLNTSILSNVEITLPPLKEQKSIASILSALDDKIELNLQMNKTLEEMAMALYKHWFVDFGPFQDGEFVATELGEIPKGWEVKKLPEISKNHNKKRKPLSTRERAKRQGRYPYYGATKILDYIDEYRFDGEFILLAEDGTVKTERDTPYLQFIEGKFWVSNHAHVLSGKGEYSNEFLFLCLNNKNLIPIITGAVQLKINKQNLESLEFVVPPKETLKKFEEIIIPHFKYQKFLSKENKNLIELRDTLLPKLISGEVRVKDVEKTLSEVL